MTRIVYSNYPVDHLPEDLRQAFGRATHVTLTVEDEQADEYLLREFDAKIQEGLDDIKAGRSHPAEQVRRLLKERFGAIRSAV